MAEVHMAWKGKQWDALQDTSRELDVEGAIRASKTTICLWRELNACLENPGIHILLARWTDSGVYGLIVPLFVTICEQAGIDLKDRWHADEEFYALPKGVRVYVRGLKAQEQSQRYSKFRGLTLARVYVDQAEEVPRDVYLELAGRLSQKGFRHCITISPQAVDEDHWIAKEFPQDNRTPDRRYIPLSVYDNAHNLDESYIPSLLRLYPPEHPKHRTLVLGQRGMNVIGDPVYGGMFNRVLHERDIAYDPRLPLEEAFDFGKHHPCVLWRQVTPLAEVRVIGGILGQNLFLEDFLPIVKTHRSEWFPNPVETKTTCDPAGAADNSQGVKASGVSILRDYGFRPSWVTNANSPAVRLAMVERIGGLMRRRSPSGSEAFGVSRDRWLRISADVVVEDRFYASGLEAGYVWDVHTVSVNNKPMRKPKKDGWFEHGQNCGEYLELAFGNEPAPAEEEPEIPYRPRASWQ